MYEDEDVIMIDEDTETLSHILTLVMKDLNPTIDLGATYEIVIRLVMQMIYEPIINTDVEEAGRDIARAILNTKTVKSKSKH